MTEQDARDELTELVGTVVDTPLDGVSATVVRTVPRGYRFHFGWGGYKFYGHHSDENRPLVAVPNL